MNPKLVLKAESRLRIARKALDDMSKAESHQEFADTWYSFLTAAKNVYTSLEQGAKDSPQCRQWFGKIKSTRKSDPLLQYLFQARDDEEHGIDFGMEEKPGSLAIGVHKPGFSGDFTIRSLAYVSNKDFSIDAKSNDGKPVLVEVTPFRSELKTVTGRGDIKYHPPKFHLGKPLPNNTPIVVGRLALSYLSAIVEDAGKRT
tara:strand:+ start:1057 stop:1659 length:603 start_codon:yes stop_codon:yes gene_type:complete